MRLPLSWRNCVLQCALTRVAPRSCIVEHVYYARRLGGPMRSLTKQQITGLVFVVVAMLLIILYFSINPNGVAFTYFNYPIFLFQGFFLCMSAICVSSGNAFARLTHE